MAWTVRGMTCKTIMVAWTRFSGIAGCIEANLEPWPTSWLLQTNGLVEDPFAFVMEHYFKEIRDTIGKMKQRQRNKQISRGTDWHMIQTYFHEYHRHHRHRLFLYLKWHEISIPYTIVISRFRNSRWQRKFRFESQDCPFGDAWCWSSICQKNIWSFQLTR